MDENFIQMGPEKQSTYFGYFFYTLCTFLLARKMLNFIVQKNYKMK